MLKPLTVLGVMSGTSADGIDAVLVHLEEQGTTLSWQVIGEFSHPYPEAVRTQILTTLRPETSEVRTITQLHTTIGHLYADLCAEVQETHSFDLIALSGQTVYHIPEVNPKRDWQKVSTLQLGEASYTVERCALPVMSDFRQSDMAAGGGGAPLVSFADFKLFSQPGKARSVHNLGGISNLTYLSASGQTKDVLAFDTGPASCLIDEAVKRHFGLEYDPNGELAAQGQVDERALFKLLEHPYFDAPPPKTTGRELFYLEGVSSFVPLDHLTPHDLLATLTAFTAQSIERAYTRFILPKGLDEIIIAGGGAQNATLMTTLRQILSVPVTTSREYGLSVTAREAVAFAVMAYYGFQRQTNTLPSATGARHAVVAGKLSWPTTC
jgi:anhydro-N-acetylmuramic acid kinase